MKFPKLQYLFRLDDICPTMNWDNFFKLQIIFEKYNIKPILGVIPNNQDTQLNIDLPREDFWQIIRDLHQKGWIIAQHGYQHKYVTNKSGIIRLNKYSEFTGLSYNEQFKKIKNGMTILEEKIGERPVWWMAPAHNFDKNTCKVLKKLNFKYITDGIALFPFKKYELYWIPQQIWRPQKKSFGTWTICIHPNSVDNNFIRQLDFFIANNIEFLNRVDLTPKKSVLNLLFTFYWYGKEYFYKFLKNI